jgi:FkbM family methyltransferase
MQRLKGLFHRVVRGLIAAPVRIAGKRTRAELIAEFSEKMSTEVAVDGQVLKFYTPTPALIRRAEDLLAKEPDMIRWLNTIPMGSILWDVGANVGVFSLYAARMRQATVLGFEPLAANFHVLSRNIQINNLEKQVTAFCVAFADGSKLGVLNVASPEMGTSLSQFGRAGEVSPYWDGSITATTQGMVGFTIDEFIAQFRPPFPNYLKIDVDGLEWPILRGAKQMLGDSRLRSAMIELSVSNKEETSEALSFLKERGLHLTSTGEIQGTASAKAANHLFERRS